jgi:hypothetical protein
MSRSLNDPYARAASPTVYKPYDETQKGSTLGYYESPPSFGWLNIGPPDGLQCAANCATSSRIPHDRGAPLCGK